MQNTQLNNKNLTRQVRGYLSLKFALFIFFSRWNFKILRET